MPTNEDFREVCAALAAEVYETVPDEQWNTFVSLPRPKHIWEAFEVTGLSDMLALVPGVRVDLLFVDAFIARARKYGHSLGSVELQEVLGELLLKYGDEAKIKAWYQQQRS